MSMRLLSARDQRRQIIHTALDDLESFLWVLVWGIVQSSKDIEGARANNPGIEDMLNAWVSNNRSRSMIVDDVTNWKDAVFGDLIRKWLRTLKQAADDAVLLTEEMFAMPLGSQEWHEACNELESDCTRVYKEVLESGFRHLEDVRSYSDWDKVVAANARKSVRIRRYK